MTDTLATARVPGLLDASLSAQEIAIAGAALASRLTRLELATPADRSTFPIWGGGALEQVAKLRVILDEIETIVRREADKRGQPFAVEEAAT